MEWLPVGLGLFLTIVGAPIWVIARLISMRREIKRLTSRIDALEGSARRARATAASSDEFAPAAETPQPISAPAVPSSAVASAAVPASPAPAPAAAMASAAAPPPTRAAAAPPAESARSFELQFGGLWLQNIGAVLLLLGAFFMILWGYTSGRFGPEVIVAAGVAAGLVLAWRGDRMVRHVPRLGHAFIGIGLGVVYLALYLGHFTLRALPAWLAFGSITLLSFASIGAGVRYRAQAISALGVIGAFVPQIVAAWIPLKGFSMTPAGLLAYLGVVNVMVFGLALRPGWSALNLLALLLSAFAWAANFQEPGDWGWGAQIALTALFALLGLAPVPRLARGPGTVRPMDLAVVALAPLCLIAASWPMLSYAGRNSVAILLFMLAAIYLLVAAWVDERRPEQDLWRPLTGAATLFLTAALQRAVGTDNTPMAWCVEGAVLAILGLRSRGGWLRFCGGFVTGVGALWMLGTLFSARWEPGALPVFYPAGIRDLVCIAAVLAGAWAFDRNRERLSSGERFLPDLWTAGGQFLLMLYAGREANHLAYALEGSGGRWQRPPAVTAPGGTVRRDALASALVGAAWLTQSLALILPSLRPGRGFVRFCGYALSALAAIAVSWSLVIYDGWSYDQFPVLHPVGLLTFAGALGLAALAAGLAARRPTLAAVETRMPELWTVCAAALMLAWAAREADHVARAIVGVPEAFGGNQSLKAREQLDRIRMLSAALTSGAWLVQAIVVLAIGWARDSSFMRWSGLVLFGLTVAKFVFYDLQAVDVFWRFLTAIVVGAVLLAVSYVYQRRSRAGSERAAGASRGQSNGG